MEFGMYELKQMIKNFIHFIIFMVVFLSCYLSLNYLIYLVETYVR